MAASGGAKTPFINEYKLQFFHRRFRQTLFGGLRLSLRAPCYISLYQIIVFVWPVVFGAIFTTLTELGILKENLSCYLYGGIMSLTVICIYVLRYFLTRHSSNGGEQSEHNILSEDIDEVEFNSCCERATFEFIFPAKTYAFNILLHGLLSGVLCGLSFLYLLPSTIQKASFNTGSTIVLCIFGWLTLCIANHSLIIQPPPEVAIFRTLDNFGLMSLMRPFYVGVITIIGVLARHYPGLVDINEALYIVMVLLPVLWIVGLLPPLDALFSWLGEQVLVFVLGGTYMASDFRLLIALLSSGIMLLIACFITNYVVLITYSAIFGFLLSLDFFQMAQELVNMQLVHVKQDRNQWNIMKFAKHSIVLTVSGSIAGICSHYYKEAAMKSTYDIFGYMFIVLIILLKVLGDMQYVYICAGLIRNPLYRKNITSIKELKKFELRMKYLGQLYNIVLTYVCPLLMVAFLSMFLNISNQNLTSFVIALGTIRALRWVWQNTMKSLIELSIVCIITWCDISSELWKDIGIGLQLMLIGLVCSRFNEFLEKAKFTITMFITSWTEPKQRHSATVPTLIISSALFPFVILILVVSVALSAPFAPLFCFPIFFVGFARPRRMWPSLSSQSSSRSEGSVFYEQLVPKLCLALQDSLASGTLVTMSDFILARYQDRFIVVQVIERGYKYCTITVKGLELQETSCHTVEAATVDDMFEEVFCKERNSSFGLNNYILNTLTPLKCMVVETYSDAKNILTGVIDNSENIERQSGNFIKCLIWVLLNHLEKQKENLSTTKKVSTKNTEEVTHASDPPNKDGVIDLKSELFPKAESPLETLTTAKRKESKDWSDTEWLSDDEDMPDFGTKLYDDPCLLFGLPAQDIGKQKPKSDSHQMRGKGVFSSTLPPSKVFPVDSLDSTSSTEHKQAFTWAILLSACKRALPQVHLQFPEEWFNFVLKSSNIGEKTAQDSNQDKTLLNLCKDVVMCCYAVINILGLHGTVQNAGPGHIHRVYHGRIPWSPELDLMEQDDELKQLVIQAFRYAFKLTYDEAVLGRIDDDDELLENLDNYKQNWFIGTENKFGWNEAILQEKPYLFSIGYDDENGTYTSHILTKQQLAVHTGTLNSEAVFGQWASLAMELLYLTNDDEERYSIQAHPVLLRNLTIQAADPPLGYAVYSSGPMHVSFGLF